MEEIVMGDHFNAGLLGDRNDKFYDDQGVFQMFHSRNGSFLQPQIVKFESKTYDQIEENLEKEILNNSLSEEAAAHNFHQSTMAHSDAQSPNKDQKKIDYSFSVASEEEIEFDNVEVNAALNDLKGPIRSENQDEDDTIGKKLIDRKRLRIFANITQKKT